MQVIDINSFKAKQQAESEQMLKKAKALRRIEENKSSDSAKFNYEFYQLVDLFMQETYPDYVLRFDVWLGRIKTK